MFSRVMMYGALSFIFCIQSTNVYSAQQLSTKVSPSQPINSTSRDRRLSSHEQKEREVAVSLQVMGPLQTTMQAQELSEFNYQTLSYDSFAVNSSSSSNNAVSTSSVSTVVAPSIGETVYFQLVSKTSASSTSFQYDLPTQELTKLVEILSWKKAGGKGNKAKPLIYLVEGQPSHYVGALVATLFISARVKNPKNKITITLEKIETQIIKKYVPLVDGIEAQRVCESLLVYLYGAEGTIAESSSCRWLCSELENALINTYLARFKGSFVSLVDKYGKLDEDLCKALGYNFKMLLLDKLKKVLAASAQREDCSKLCGLTQEAAQMLLRIMSSGDSGNNSVSSISPNSSAGGSAQGSLLSGLSPRNASPRATAVARDVFERITINPRLADVGVKSPLLIGVNSPTVLAQSFVSDGSAEGNLVVLPDSTADQVIEQERACWLKRVCMRYPKATTTVAALVIGGIAGVSYYLSKTYA